MAFAKRSAVALVALMAVVLATVAGAQGMNPWKKGQTSLGEVFQTQDGMTLYTFAKDTADKSACNDKCAANWPPLMAGADAKAFGPWTIVTRDDGSKQWAFKGKPLYSFVKDKAAGDTMGEGMNKVWSVAKP